MTTRFTPSLGATVGGGGVRFRVWAPAATSVDTIVETPGRVPTTHPMARDADGYFEVTVASAADGDRYRYRPDGRGPFPDPASRFQPDGVHGPSQVVDWRLFPWTDQAWRGVPLAQTILYELHVGTFTPDGTFAAAAATLPYLVDLGVTAIELMPVADFPGRWNWGYDGVAPFAPARCYGSPDDLRRLVDAAHGLGLAVHLDVVYNHLGPDGAYQFSFSPHYHSATHTSPWGPGINFDGPASGPVREYVIENALRWVLEYHIDGLRLDAIHAIVDDSPRHILACLAEAVHTLAASLGRRVLVIAEDSRNLARVVKPEPVGWGLDGNWSDDIHHQARRLVAGDRDGYFADFDGTAADLATTIRRGWFYVGQHAPYFGGPRGTDPSGLPLPAFVAFVQNHDQIGNRAFGDRLHHAVDLAAWRAVSVLLLTLPETPLLFMGQEWAASTPFQFFTDHHDELGRQVTEGRRREFERFAAFAEPAAQAAIPDPQAESTFRASGLDWGEVTREPHAGVLALYRRLLALRRAEHALRHPAAGGFTIDAVGEDTLAVCRRAPDGEALLVIVRLRGEGPVDLRHAAIAALPDGHVWNLVLTTEQAPYVADARPLEVDAAGPVVRFGRPGAVVFKAARWPAEGNS